MNINQLIKAIQFDKYSLDYFFTGSCAVILVLRLCLPVLLGDSYLFVSENLCNLVAAGLIFILSFLFIFSKFFNRETILKCKLDIPILLALAAASLSLIYSASFGESLSSLLIFVSYVLLFYILHDSLNSKDVLFVFWCYFLMCSLLVSSIAIGEYLFAKYPLSLQMRRTLPGFYQGAHLGFFYKRVASLFDWPNILAGFQMLVIPLSWVGLMLSPKLWQKRIIAISIALFLVVFFLTFSLMCCISFLAVSFFILPLILKECHKVKINKAPFWVVGVSLVLFFLTIILVRKDFDIAARIGYLKLAFQLLKDNPWLGSGADTFSTVSAKYVSNTLGFTAYVHNSYLQLWVENGMLGFMAVISLVVVFILTAHRMLKKEEDHAHRIIIIGFVWAITAFLIDNLSSFTMLRPNVAFFWWALLAAFFAFERITTAVKRPNIITVIARSEATKQSLKELAIKTSCLFILAILIFFIIRMSLALLSYQGGVNSFARRDLKSAAVLFNRSMQLDPFGFNYPMAMGSVDLRRFALSHDPRFLDMAEREYEKARRLAPEFHKIYFILSTIFAEKKDFLRADQYLKQAVRLCPMAYSKLGLPKAFFK